MFTILDPTEKYLEDNKETILKELEESKNFKKIAAKHDVRWQKLQVYSKEVWGYHASWRANKRVNHDYDDGVYKKPIVNKKIPTGFNMVEYTKLWIEKQRMIQLRSFAQDKATIEIPPIYTLWVGHSDLHVFGDGTDMERFMEDVELLKDAPATYIFNMGDFIDNGGNITRSNRGRKNDDIAEIQHAAIDWYFDELGHKIMAYVIGNHDEWSYQSDGRDHGEYWASKADGVFLGFEGEAEIRIRDPDTDKIIMTYNNWITHTTKGFSMYNPTHGGHRTLTEKRFNVDAVWWGHIHNTAIQKKWKNDYERVVFIRGGGYQMDARYPKGWSLQRGGLEIPAAIYSPYQKNIMADTDFTGMIEIVERLNYNYSKDEIKSVKIIEETSTEKLDEVKETKVKKAIKKVKKVDE